MLESANGVCSGPKKKQLPSTCRTSAFPKLEQVHTQLHAKLCPENEWFVNSEKKIEPFTDFYVWKDGKMVDGQMCPPNNWKSFFSGPAWKYSEKRKQYFLKIF